MYRPSAPLRLRLRLMLLEAALFLTGVGLFIVRPRLLPYVGMVVVFPVMVEALWRQYLQSRSAETLDTRSRTGRAHIAMTALGTCIVIGDAFLRITNPWRRCCFCSGRPF